MTRLQLAAMAKDKPSLFFDESISIGSTVIITGLYTGSPSMDSFVRCVGKKFKVVGVWGNLEEFPLYCFRINTSVASYWVWSGVVRKV